MSFYGKDEIPDWITNLNFTARTALIIHRGGVTSFSELCSLSDPSLLRMRNMGQNSLQEIREKCSFFPPSSLSKHGLQRQVESLLTQEEDPGPWGGYGSARDKEKGEVAEVQCCQMKDWFVNQLLDELKGVEDYANAAAKMKQMGNERIGDTVQKFAQDEYIHYLAIKGIVDLLTEDCHCDTYPSFRPSTREDY